MVLHLLKGEKMINQNESGRTMLEMLGVLAIMGIIVYGAIAGINYGMSSYRVNQTYSDIQDIVQGVEDLFSWSKGYPSGDDVMKAACDNDVFPRACEGNKAPSQFGDISVVGIDCNGNLCHNFQVSIKVPKPDDRARLQQLDWAAIHVNCDESGMELRFTPQ